MAWAREIYVATSGCGVYYTSNFVDPSIQPIWQRVNNGLLNLNCLEFHLDPFRQSDVQYLLTGDHDHITDETLYRRSFGGDWEPLLTRDDFAKLFSNDPMRWIHIEGFCTDSSVDGRLWVVGKLLWRDLVHYGPFGDADYYEIRAAYTNDYGETWHGVPTWWTGWNVATPTSIRAYGDIIYVRDGGGVGDVPYIEYSYNRGTSWNWIGTDLVQYTLGGFLNPLTPERFYYDTNGVAFRYFQNGSLYTTIDGIKLGDSQWDTIWCDPNDFLHMRLIFNNQVWTTYDGWATATGGGSISTVYNKTSLSPYAGDSTEYIILGMNRHVGWEPNHPSIATLYGENDTNLIHIAGTNWNVFPYTDSIPGNNTPCRCGIQGVQKQYGYIYVNAVGMPGFVDTTSGYSGHGVPMDGDRSAWNVKYYKRRHANDIDSGSSTSIHHTLSTHFVNKTTGSYKEAPGDHSHYLRDMDSGSSVAGEILTSLGTGSPTWHTLADHSHAGSAIGDGGRFNADHLSSVSQLINFALTYYSGSVIWKPVIGWNLSLVENTSLNSSDKEFTVPPNTELQILWAWIEFTSTATSGSRQVEIQLTDPLNNIIGKWQAGATQNSNTICKYMFAMVVPDLTSFRDGNYLMTPIPSSTFLSAGQKIRIWDNKAVDSFADDMIVRLQYSYHTV